MRRFAPILLLTIPTLCWAGPELPDQEQKRGACVYARPAATPISRVEGDVPQARPAVPPVARSAPQAPANGGGGDSDGVVPRARGGRWHSFLPGMFR